jgi:hypothetical protein
LAEAPSQTWLSSLARGAAVGLIFSLRATDPSTNVLSSAGIAVSQDRTTTQDFVAGVQTPPQTIVVTTVAQTGGPADC